MSERSTPPVPRALTAVAMEAESGCSRCSRRILLLEKAFLDDRYAAVCVECAAGLYNGLKLFVDEPDLLDNPGC